DHHGSAYKAIECYQQRIVENGGPRFTVGISPSIHSFSRVRDALAWATAALELAFFQGRGQCYQGRIPAVDDGKLTDKHDELQQERKKLREKFSRSFASSDRELCMKILELYVLQWK